MNAGRTAVIVLAAGAGRRMGATKQLLPYHGVPLVRHAARIALQSRLGPVIVVVGHDADAVKAALADEPVRVEPNPAWEDGIGTSIRAGVAAASSLGSTAVLLMLADQPLLTPAVLVRLLAEHARSRSPVVASEYAGTVGVPVLFGSERFPRLLALEAGEGCKGCILEEGHGALRIPCPEAAFDVDTPQDYGAIALDR